MAAERGYRAQEGFPGNTSDAFHAVGNYATRPGGIDAIRRATDIVLTRSFLPLRPYVSSFDMFADHVGEMMKLSPGGYDNGPKMDATSPQERIVNNVLALSVVLAGIQEAGIVGADPLSMLTELQGSSVRVVVPKGFTNANESLVILTPEGVADEIQRTQGENPYLFQAVYAYARAAFAELPNGEAQFDDLRDVINATATLGYLHVTHFGSEGGEGDLVPRIPSTPPIAGRRARPLPDDAVLERDEVGTQR